MSFVRPADSTETASSGMRREVERWFVERGVPQFVEGYSTEQSMDARAAPLIAGWLIILTSLYWVQADQPAVWTLLGIVGSIVFIALAYTAIGWLRGRTVASLPEKFDPIDIALFGVLPALPAALVVRAPLDAIFAGLNALLGVGIIYLVIAFGLLELGLWAIRRLREQLGHIATLLARTLPVLLILVVFLLFATEIWEVAHGVNGGELAVLLLLLLVIAALLITSTFRPEIRRLEERGDWDVMLAEARHTPAAPLADALRRPGNAVPPLSWLQRRNLDFLVLINQILHSTFVALLVMAILVAFGVLALPASVQEAWIGEPVAVVQRFELLGETRTVSAELLTVSALLGGIVGLYFTGLALTDPTYRAEHFTQVGSELGTLLSARAVYLAAAQADPDERAT